MSAAEEGVQKHAQNILPALREVKLGSVSIVFRVVHAYDVKTIMHIVNLL